MSADWVTANATVALAIATGVLALFTLLVFIVAVFQDRIHSRLTRPKLEVSIRTAPPDCHKVPMTGPYKGGVSVRRSPIDRVFVGYAYYFRLRISNKGNDKAESVEVLLVDLSQKGADGTFNPIESFLPLNLRWTNSNEAYMSAISPDIDKLCDLGHIMDPEKRQDETWSEPAQEFSREKTILSLETTVESNTMSHLIRPGNYLLRIIVAAANSKPVRKTLEINLTGTWYDDEREMLDHGIGIKMVN